MEIQTVVLLSGGLDSTFNLYASAKEWPQGVIALTLNYGQKAWESERRTAEKLADHLSIPIQVMDISNIFAGDKSSLTSQEKIPTGEVDIESLSASENTAKKVWVSNRNGVLLNIAACVAEKLGAQWVVPGFNAEEAATFPDNSVDYIEKMNACLKLSTSNGVQIRCFSQSMEKKQIAQSLVALGGDLNLIWSCYFAGDKMCGECESCQRFNRAKNSINQ